MCVNHFTEMNRFLEVNDLSLKLTDDILNEFHKTNEILKLVAIEEDLAVNEQKRSSFKGSSFKGSSI